MTQIFISHAHEDVLCAEQIRHDLEAAGYAVWKDSQSIAPGSPSYVRAIENGIRGSAATLVIWSRAAAESEWVERELLYSGQLKKPIFPVRIDATEPGILLVAAQYVESKPPCVDAVAKLLGFLPPVTNDGLQQVALLLAHPHINEQIAGIGEADILLQAGRYREELLALLEDIMRKSLFTTVQEAAQKVLEADEQRNAPPARPEKSRHNIEVRCNNGHVTYFDKREICPDSGKFQRSRAVRGGKTVDNILLKCPTCGEEIVVPVDCEGYK